MQNWGASGYRNYGMIPANEYTTTYTDKGKYFDEVSEQASQAESMEREQHLSKRQARYQAIRVRRHGWLRSRSTNGWRAESASSPYEY